MTSYNFLSDSIRKGPIYKLQDTNIDIVSIEPIIIRRIGFIKNPIVSYVLGSYVLELFTCLTITTVVM